MKTLLQVYKKLNKKFESPNLVFDEQYGKLDLQGQDYYISTYIHNNLLVLYLLYDNQEFMCYPSDCKSVYNLLYSLLDGRASITRIDQRYISINGWDLKPVKTFGFFKKILCILSGILLFVLSLSMLALIIEDNINSSTYEKMANYSLVFIMLGCIWVGINCFKYCSQQEMFKRKFNLYNTGIMFVNFWLTTLFMMWANDIGKGEVTLATFGASVCMICFSLSGALMIYLSSKKDNLKTQLIRRVPRFPSVQDVDKIVSCILEEYKQQIIKVNISENVKPNIFNSKLGGIPYWDSSMKYPVDSSGEPMIMLAQLNLCELPDNVILSKNGMLQFFVSLDDLEEGLYEDARLIYHPYIDANINEKFVINLEAFHTINVSEYVYEPSENGECALSFEQLLEGVLPQSYHLTSCITDIALKNNIQIDETIEFFELIQVASPCLKELCYDSKDILIAGNINAGSKGRYISISQDGEGIGFFIHDAITSNDIKFDVL